MEVAVSSVIRPYKADNVLNFSIRYQNVNNATSTTRGITRAFLLNTLIVNQNAGTSNYRVCAAVRVNRVRIYTASSASLEWQSAYGPTSATIVQGTSTTASGILMQKPPKNSLASYWSLTGSNESESLFTLGCGFNDVIDVDYSVVLMDAETPVNVTSFASGTVGQLYRSYLDGPDAADSFRPIYMRSLN
jgi:hypothetical protein